MLYASIKQLHITLALLSFSFFLLRAYWAFNTSALMQKKWVRISPHVIDTVLLLSAIVLMLTINQYPFLNSWLTAKFLALCLYIIFASLALKNEKNKPKRFMFLLLAIASFAYIYLTARQHQPLFL